MRDDVIDQMRGGLRHAPRPALRAEPAALAKLINKYRAIFERDVSEVDEGLSDRLIIEAIPQALDDVRQSLPGAGAP